MRKAPAGHITGRAFDRTKNGLLMVVAALAMSWIPYIKYIGDLLMFIGAILIILGRIAFSKRHERFVVISILIYITSIIAIAVEGVILVLSLLQSASNATAFVSTMSGFLVTTIVLGAYGNLSYLTLVWNISTRNTQRLLLLAYAVGIVITVINYFLVMGVVNTYAAAASHNANQAISNLLSHISTLELLDGFPFMLLAFAYYWVYAGIVSGAIKH